MTQRGAGRVLRGARAELEELAHWRCPAEEGKAVAAPTTFPARGIEPKPGLAREEDAPSRYCGGAEDAPPLARGRLRLRTCDHGPAQTFSSRIFSPPAGTRAAATLCATLWAAVLCASL